MSKTMSFGARSTADQVLAGIDLTGKQMLVTECASSIGFETASALAANGAHIIAAARTLPEAREVCQEIGYHCSPLACDLSDLGSVAAACETVRQIQPHLDAIVANAGGPTLTSTHLHYGVEEHLLVNHVGYVALVNDLSGALREASGRLVIVSNGAAGQHQSNVALALYAKELSRRQQGRGVAVNAVDPGLVSELGKPMGLVGRLLHYAARSFRRSAAQGAATSALLAANPRAAGISGEYWRDCRIARANPVVDDKALAVRLWDTSEAIIAQHRASRLQAVAEAA